jgi:acetolactate synthase-1/2/3 large subunit
MKKISDLVFDFIADKSIDTVFTISGGGCMHLTDSLGKNKRLKYVCNHHEQACAMAAEGYAKVAGKPGCVLITTGPGGTNTLTGVLGAYQDSVPMIIISGQVPKAQLSNNTGCRQIGQQEFNIVDTVKFMTKYAVTITDPSKILYHLEKAYHISTQGRPGPVWLDIPLDIQSSQVALDTLKRFKIKKQFKIGNLFKSCKANKLQTLLDKSKKPVVVVGGGVRASNTVGELMEFLNRTNIPVLTGPHSAVDVVNDTYEYYAGRFGLLGQYTSNQIIQESDLVISLGSRLNPKMIGYDSMKFAPQATKFVVDIDVNEIRKLKFNKKESWCIDLRDFFKHTTSLKTNDNISEWQSFVKNKRAVESLVLDKHRILKEYTSTYVFAESLEKHLSQDATIVTSNGTAHVVPLKTIRLRGSQRLFSNEGTAPMGYGLPAAIGAYYGTKEPIICIEGDGSIMMNLQELETVRYNNIPLKIFIINNLGYLSIKLTQGSFFKGHLVASEESSGVSIPSFKKLANVFGLDYYSILDNSDIDSKLKKIFRKDGPMIIEVFTDPNELHEPKVVSKGIDAKGNIIPGELTNMNL